MPERLLIWKGHRCQYRFLEACGYLPRNEWPRRGVAQFKASGMHAAPISSQRTFLRVFVRLDAHHLLMVAKKDREKLGGLGGGETLRFRISQKVQVSGRVSEARSVWKPAAKAERAV